MSNGHPEFRQNLLKQKEPIDDASSELRLNLSACWSLEAQDIILCGREIEITVDSLAIPTIL